MCSNHTGPICFSSSLGLQGSVSSEIKVATSCNSLACGTARQEGVEVEHGVVGVAPETSPDGQTLGNLILAFSRDELCGYVDARVTGLAPVSVSRLVIQLSRNL